MKYPIHLLKELKCKRLTIINAGKDVEQPELSLTASRIEKRYSHFWRQFGNFYKAKDSLTIQSSNYPL